jgi:Histidine kinase-, DNA gyrase B-, and HSP90-like ATPase
MNNYNLFDTKEVTIDSESIRTELKSYADKPYNCLFEYFWNAFDAGAKIVEINFNKPDFGGIEDLIISDNGSGWNFESKNTQTFMSSTKKVDSSADKSIPHGKLGRGRYSFIWIADRIKINSGDNFIILDKETRYKVESSNTQVSGTEIVFVNPTRNLSDALLNEDALKKSLVGVAPVLLRKYNIRN